MYPFFVSLDFHHGLLGVLAAGLAALKLVFGNWLSPHNINLLNLRKHFTETATDQPALAGKHEVDAFEVTQVVHRG